MTGTLYRPLDLAATIALRAAALACDGRSWGNEDRALERDEAASQLPVSLFDMAEEPRELLGGTSSALLHFDALSVEESTRSFEDLLRGIPWEQRQVRMFGKEVDQPRLVAWCGDSGRDYNYSGISLSPQPWTKLLMRLRAVCEGLANASFNSVLLNLYRDGNDTVAWHSDDEPELGAEPVIASLSLGATRRFDLRNKATQETIKVDLPPGSVVVMSGRCQAEWSHQVPRSKRVRSPRVNLTFRRILDD